MDGTMTGTNRYFHSKGNSSDRNAAHAEVSVEAECANTTTFLSIRRCSMAASTRLGRRCRTNKLIVKSGVCIAAASFWCMPFLRLAFFAAPPSLGLPSSSSSVSSPSFTPRFSQEGRLISTTCVLLLLFFSSTSSSLFFSFSSSFLSSFLSSPAFAGISCASGAASAVPVSSFSAFAWLSPPSELSVFFSSSFFASFFPSLLSPFSFSASASGPSMVPSPFCCPTRGVEAV
mmetsp:Transcript_17093/g.23929  ORF Transcript_17093/g.23929 Transcript_17093/m.23929 type:complete len:231 (+) Transcript_17093:1618-2310(+)